MKNTCLQTLSPAHKSYGARRAFSIIELMIGLFIIGLGASMVMPRLLRKAPEAQWPAIRAELDSLLAFARQEAISTQTVHRLTFNKKERSVVVEKRDGLTEKGQPRFTKVASFYTDVQYNLPEKVRLEALLLGKKDLLEENKGIGWCYIVPNGLVQSITLSFTRDDGGSISKQEYETTPFLGTVVEKSTT